MPKQLDNLIIRGVALVDRGANQHAKVLISKRAGDMPDDDKMKDLQKQLDEANAKAAEAAKELAALKAQGTLSGDLETTKRQLADLTKQELLAREELQKQIDARTKELSDSRAEVEKINKQRRRESFIKRVGELPNLPGAPADDFAEMLDDIELALSPTADKKRFEKFNRMLTAWDVIVGKSKIFEEIGRSGIPGSFTGAAGQLHALAKEAHEKDPKKSFAQHYDEVLKANPAIYRRYQAEQER